MKTQTELGRPERHLARINLADSEQTEPPGRARQLGWTARAVG